MKRAGSGGSLQLQEPKTAKQEDKGMADAAEKEHVLLMRVLQPEPAPSGKLSLANLVEYFEKMCSTKGLEQGLLLIGRAWKRSEEGGVVPSTWSGIKDIHDASLTVSLSMLLAASAPEKVKVLSSLLETMAPQKLVNEMLAAVAEDSQVCSQLLIETCKPLRGRILNGLKAPEYFRLVRILKSSKSYVTALVSSPCLETVWRPKFEPGFTWRNKKREVMAINDQVSSSSPNLYWAG
jgi:hypothetical protein